MLALDSLVIDLIFQAEAEIDPESLVEALGGQEVAANRKILDPDMQDPRFEMELSPSMPFRRRGERRLMIIDDGVAPMREDPRAESKVPIDLRAERQRLIEVCEAGPIRLGRIFALGSWGDAVLVARSPRDLRGIALLAWVLDPTVDVDGKRRAGRLDQKEFEAKILAYDQRLAELDDEEVLKNLGPARLERRDEVVVVDVLEADGTWDLRKSLMMESALAAIDKFSMIPGAPADPAAARAAAPAPEPAPSAPPEPAAPPLRWAEVAGRVVLVFSAERFDLDVAAALGKGSWDTILRRGDDVAGEARDRIYQHGAGFVAPLEFLSEVFIDGTPLSRPVFEERAREVAGGGRALEVHCPRFGPVVLIDIPGKGRFISSEVQHPAEVARLV